MKNGMYDQRLAERLLRLTASLMPAGRSEWGQAMKAEAAYVQPGSARLVFAAGCLRSAFIERLLASLRNSAALQAGSIMGCLFFAHAAVRGSHAWPLIWPFLSGILAVLLSSRGGPQLHIRGGAWLAFRAGAVTGFLFFASGGALVLAAADVSLISRLHILAAGATSGLILSTVGGGAACMFARLR